MSLKTRIHACTHVYSNNGYINPQKDPNPRSYCLYANQTREATVCMQNKPEKLLSVCKPNPRSYCLYANQTREATVCMQTKPENLLSVCKPNPRSYCLYANQTREPTVCMQTKPEKLLSVCIHRLVGGINPGKGLPLLVSSVRVHPQDNVL